MIYIFMIVFIICIASMILDSTDDNTRRYGHRDSRPGSYYEISNRKKD